MSANDTSLAATDKLLEISQSRTWMLLLGYTDSGQSEIVTESFFLADDGNRNPQAELIATLDAFSRPAGGSDQHAQCRFPARYIYLRSLLELQDFNINPVDCPEFDKFLYDGHLTGISLVFASGYFGNPASYYGHLLIKLETDKPDLTDLEKTAINFGAIYPPDENMPTYIIKGVFGGYSSMFKEHPYYEQSLNYGEVDLRDVWEYELNLTDDELLLLAAHIWELLGVEYTYFFFDRNCGFRMAKALELVTDDRLVEDNRWWQIPQHLIQQLSATTNNGAPLIKETRYIPSRQSRLYKRYLALSGAQQEYLTRIIDNIETLDSPEFDNLSLDSQHRILDTLLDYYQYLIIKDLQDIELAKSNYQSTLKKRYSLPPGISQLDVNAPVSPSEGRNPSYFQLGLLQQDSQTELAIKIRPAYYDGLDYGSGHIKNSSLSMAEVDVVSNEDKALVKSIGIVNVESIQSNVTNLPGDQTHSWYINSYLFNNSLSSNSDFDLYVNAGMGLTKSIVADKLLVSGFLGGGVSGNKLEEEAITASARLVFNVNLASDLRFRLEARNDRFIKTRQDQYLYVFEGRKQLTTNSDVRIKYQDGEESQYQISAGFYW